VLVNGGRYTNPDAEWGTQQTVQFQTATATRPALGRQMAIDVKSRRDVSLWRVTATVAPDSSGAFVLGRLIFGTGSSIEIGNLILPLIAHVPGNCQLYLEPSFGGPDVFNCHVTLKPVSSPGRNILRTFIDASGGSEVLPRTAVSFYATSASTLNRNGLSPQALAVGESAPVYWFSSISAGGYGIAEHEI
jgi:hypothetical protein